LYLHVMIALGGMGGVLFAGVLGGIVIVQFLQLGTRFLQGTLPITANQFASVRFIILGAMLVLVIRYKPEGIWGSAKRQGVSTE